MKTLSDHAGRILFSDANDGAVGSGGRDLRARLNLLNKENQATNKIFLFLRFKMRKL